MHVNTNVWMLFCCVRPTLFWTLEASVVCNLSVSFLVCSCGAVNSPAEWICLVSEGFDISKYVFCTAVFTEEHQAEHLQNVCYWGFFENLTYKSAVIHNQCVIHLRLWCQMMDIIQSALKYSYYSLCMTGDGHSFDNDHETVPHTSLPKKQGNTRKKKHSYKNIQSKYIINIHSIIF